MAMPKPSNIIWRDEFLPRPTFVLPTILSTFSCNAMLKNEREPELSVALEGFVTWFPGRDSMLMEVGEELDMELTCFHKIAVYGLIGHFLVRNVVSNC